MEKETPQDIIVGFSTGSSIVARLIRWFTQSKISHVYVRYYDCSLGTWMVIGAKFLGVEVESFSKFKEKSKIIFEFKCLKSLDVALKTMSSRIGQPYDFPALLGMSWVVLMWKWMKVRIVNPFSDSRTFICTEFVMDILRMGRLNGLPGYGSESVTPEELFKFCANDDQFVSIG